MCDCGTGTVLYPAGTVKRLLSGGVEVEAFLVLRSRGAAEWIGDDCEQGSRRSADLHTCIVLVIGEVFPSAELAGMVVIHWTPRTL
jgi:hypothetical protein